MPVLRRPHDRYRDLRAQLLSAHASRKCDQNRHLMMIVATSRPRKARHSPLFRRPQRRLLGAVFRNSTEKDFVIDAPPFGCNDTASSPISAHDRRVKTQTPRPPRSNLHSARHRQTFPPARFPPLEAFGRRPPRLPRRSSAAGIRNPSQKRYSVISITLDGGKRHLRLEGRCVVPACSSAHGLS